MKTPYLIRTTILAVGLLLQLSIFSLHSRGAAGDVDLSFDPGSGVNGTVHAVALLPDGKVLIGGEFTTVKGLLRTNLARLNADGSGDNSFNAGTGYSFNKVRSIAIQPDGKVLVGRDSGITRLNSDGSVDANFNTGGWEPVINSIAVQPDGKVLIGGFFDEFHEGTSTGVARLNSDGSFDGSFIADTGDYPVYAVVLQSDGKVLIGGFRPGVARLNANGSLDTSFASAADGFFYSLEIQSDGKVLAAGQLVSAANGTNRNGIVRLNVDGSLDSSFDRGTAPPVIWVHSIVLQSDGKVLMGSSGGIARLNTNGSLDGSFNVGTGANGEVRAVVVQQDGKVLVGGDFTRVNGTNRNRMARLNADGSLDGSFHPGRGVDYAEGLWVQPDGKVLVGGVRLNADGSLDSTYTCIPNTNFNPNTSVPGTDYSVPQCSAVQPDGKVLIGGYTYTEVPDQDGGYFPVYSYFLYRFHPDGSRDLGFEPALGSPSYYDFRTIRTLAVQLDGKVLMGGTIGIARLNANGTVDSSFVPGTGGSVSSVALQADGKVLIGGAFIYNGTNYSYGIARLNTNGSLDSTFHPGTGANGNVSTVVMQSDGKVLIGGEFTTVNGTNRNRMARLNADGSLDTSFNPGTGANGSVRAIALQSDGKVLIGGEFLTVNGVLRPYVARLCGDSPASFAGWAAQFGLSSASAAANADPDFDGLPNGVEYVLGGNPTQSSESASERPAVAVSGGYLTVTFQRDDASEAPGVTLSVESGTNLINWPEVFAIGPTNAVSSPGVSISENGTAPDLITVSISIGNEEARFARLKVAIAP